MTISNNFKAAAISEAENCLNADLGAVTDELYTEFSESGNRVNYEAVNFKRRIILNRLALGEICEGKGRFTAEIERAAIAVLDEKTWVLPAHSNGVLPSEGERIIDLFSSQTAAALSVISAYIPVSKALYERIFKAVTERIFEPFLKYDYWWLNSGKNRRKNPSNWTPWCIHGVIECARAFKTDYNKQITERCERGLLNYFYDYPDDGGCDEGAQYWAHSVGHFFECGLQITDINKLCNMYSFIMRANLSGNSYMNFADCAARFYPDAAMIFLMGRQVKNERLMAFAAKVLNKDDYTMRDNMDLRAKINAAKVSEELEKCSPDFMESDKDIIQSLGVGIFRNNTFALAAKGGHNGENHNHNDCGNFIIINGELPVIIDAGVGEYTKDTFSNNRYKIWTMRSSYHNLPVINGYEQCSGGEFAARGVEFHHNGMVCDIAGAYPAASGLKRAERRSELSYNKVSITDRFEFFGEKNTVRVNLMLPCMPVLSGGGLTVNGCRILIDAADWSAEEIYFGNDEKLSPVWGDRLYRVSCNFECGRVFAVHMRVIKEP